MDENEEKLKVLKKRGFIVKEIISTEVTYVDRLSFAVEVVIVPLRENNLLESNDLSAQFSIMEKICALHSTQSIAELESDPDKLGVFFNHICNNVQIYTDYLVNYESAMQRRCSLLISNRKFSDFLDKAEKDPRLQNQKIESIFILPVQRIPRYRLLLEQLLKYTPEDHPQFTDVKNALDKICDMALYSNEAIRARENRAKIMDIIKTIEPRTRVDLLADPDRSFIKEGPLLRQCRRGLKEFHFWLFNDQLLYGQATPLGLYILNRQIDLTKCYVNACESMHEEGFSFIVESPAKSFIICFTTEQEKNEWYEAINAAIVALSQSRQDKQHNRQFAPLWMPDKTTTRCQGQRCHSVFSLINRRHHCRNCGAIVCDACSKKRIKLEHVDQHRQVRVCDGCFLYLSSSGAKNSLRMESLRLRSGNFTDASNAAVIGSEEDLYVSDNDEEGEESYERDADEVNEDDLNDFNDVIKDPRALMAFQRQVSLGPTNNLFRQNNKQEEISPSLLQQVGKTTSGVLSFSNPISRGAPRPAFTSSKSMKLTPSTTGYNGSSSSGVRSNSDELAPSTAPSRVEHDSFTPPKPPKPVKPLSLGNTHPRSTSTDSPKADSSPTATSAVSPVASSPVARPAPFTRPGLLRSVSTFVTTSTNFLTTGSTTGNSTPATPVVASPPPAARSPLPSSPKPPKPTPPRPAAEEIPLQEMNSVKSNSTEDSHNDGTSRASERSTQNGTQVGETTSGSTEDSVEDSSESSPGVGAPPPVKPPKPPRMPRRTNICISADDLEAAQHIRLSEEDS